MITDTLTTDELEAARSDFDAFWQTLLSQSEGMRACAERPDAKIRGLDYRDFRAAMLDSFIAGRAAK
jgi:hypothetical protein